MDEDFVVDEDDWNTCQSVSALLSWLRRIDVEVSRRKTRLFACACFRLIWNVVDDSSRKFIGVVEDFADGGATEETLLCEMQVAREAVVALETRISSTPGWHLSDGPAILTAVSAFKDLFRLVKPGSFGDRSMTEADPRPQKSVQEVSSHVVNAHMMLLCDNAHARFSMDAQANAVQEARVRRGYEQARAVQADLLRHIVGNVINPPPPLPYVPSLLRNLAQQIYDQDISIIPALHDALEEAGMTALATHFVDRQERHPKGCWALDVILGKS